jgi:hypothetical protein
MTNHQFMYLNGEELTELTAILLPIIITLGAFLMIFGLRYLKYKERQTLIDKGIDPGPMKGFMNYSVESVTDLKIFNARKTNNTYILSVGLLTIGFGVALLLSYWITTQTTFKGEPEPIYFGLIAICSGLGLLISYYIHKKDWDAASRKELNKE